MTSPLFPAHSPTFLMSVVPPSTKLPQLEMRASSLTSPSPNIPKFGHFNLWLSLRAVLVCWRLSSFSAQITTIFQLVFLSSAYYCYYTFHSSAGWILSFCCMMKQEVRTKYFCISKYVGCFKEKRTHNCLSCKLSWPPFHRISFLFERTDELCLFRHRYLTDIC